MRVDAAGKDEFDRWKRLIVPPLSKLGADAAAVTGVRLTRLPGCLRGERMQRLLYLDPEARAPGVPILWRHEEGRRAA